jgi:hypothetical protein
VVSQVNKPFSKSGKRETGIREQEYRNEEQEWDPKKGNTRNDI